tara:strand:- start:200 stop:508 length:309 start_codon:yes stop_codon:yes gene_type:complete
MDEVEIKFNISDLEGFWDQSFRSFYFEQSERFEDISKHEMPFDEDKGTYMYTVIGYGNALLFSKILEALGFLSFIVNDLYNEEPDTYTILTNFSDSWEDHEE